MKTEIEKDIRKRDSGWMREAEKIREETLALQFLG